MSAQLKTGQIAPSFTLPDSASTPVNLADYAGRRVVVYFYPKAATPGCTTEACDFRDSLAALQAGGIDVIGISPDGAQDLAAFATDNSLNFPLLSDQDHEVAQAYGAWGDKVINGKPMVGTLRSTVVVNKDGTVHSAQYNVDAKGHVAALRTALGL